MVTPAGSAMRTAHRPTRGTERGPWMGTVVREAFSEEGTVELRATQRCEECKGFKLAATRPVWPSYPSPGPHSLCSLKHGALSWCSISAHLQWGCAALGGPSPVVWYINGGGGGGGENNGHLRGGGIVCSNQRPPPPLEPRPSEVVDEGGAHKDKATEVKTQRWGQESRATSTGNKQVHTVGHATARTTDTAPGTLSGTTGPQGNLASRSHWRAGD